MSKKSSAKGEFLQFDLRKCFQLSGLPIANTFDKSIEMILIAIVFRTCPTLTWEHFSQSWGV
jgi:hypothetical protein